MIYSYYVLLNELLASPPAHRKLLAPFKVADSVSIEAALFNHIFKCWSFGKAGSSPYTGKFPQSYFYLSCVKTYYLVAIQS